MRGSTVPVGKMARPLFDSTWFLNLAVADTPKEGPRRLPGYQEITRVGTTYLPVVSLGVSEICVIAGLNTTPGCWLSRT